MVKAIVWTHEAIITYEKIIEYLFINFSEKEIIKFSKSVQNKIDLLAGSPNIYRTSHKFSNVHYTIILKRILLVYRYRPRKKIVEILQFWDARQNPKRFKF